MTVFTPTYNRAHTLPRVYDSLRGQTRGDFEWLVIDDGSTDGTRELIAGWRAQASFSIRYEFQKNRGKHAAYNRAVELAAGELFVNLDSDDACLPHALETFLRQWQSIESAERDCYSAVTCLCQDQHGNVVGDPFPQDGMDADYLSLRYRYKVGGEKWSCHRTDVLRAFPFPAERAYYLPEGIIWSRVARRYRERCINQPLRIYYLEGPSLVHGQSPARAAEGGRAQHLHALNEELDFFRYAPLAFLRSAVHYARFSWHQGIGAGRQFRDLHGITARLLWLAALPLGWLAYRRDQ
ncbi:MAG: glycosyltransferase family 2 protein [Pirellulales bacterium]